MNLNEIKIEIQKKNYTMALDMMESFPEDSKNAEFHLLRGICIQIPNATKLTDKDAEFSLRKAIELDSNYKDAKLELAYFLLNVRHDPSEAKLFFLDVLKETRDNVPESLSSIMKSSQELAETNSNFQNSLKLQTKTYLGQNKVS